MVKHMKILYSFDEFTTVKRSWYIYFFMIILVYGYSFMVILVIYKYKSRSRPSGNRFVEVRRHSTAGGRSGGINSNR